MQLPQSPGHRAPDPPHTAEPQKALVTLGLDAALASNWRREPQGGHAGPTTGWRQYLVLNFVEFLCGYIFQLDLQHGSLDVQ